MQREQNSDSFFKVNADRFRKQQELIAPWADYAEISLQLLDRLTEVPFRTLLEVGVGEGWLLPELHKRAKNVIALDLSGEMLFLARATLATSQALSLCRAALTHSSPVALSRRSDRQYGAAPRAQPQGHTRGSRKSADPLRDTDR